MVIRWDVLGIGTAAVDELLLVERFPQPDSKVDILESYRQGGRLGIPGLETVRAFISGDLNEHKEISKRLSVAD
jgi:hypothetical protein